MTCNCFSYNAQEGETPNMILDPNEYFDWTTPAKTVCVDACIAEQIKSLWEAGIWTKGCCCGHGKENPNVIIDTDQDPQHALWVLEQVDPERQWIVLQWQLVKTNQWI